MASNGGEKVADLDRRRRDAELERALDEGLPKRFSVTLPPSFFTDPLGAEDDAEALERSDDAA